MQDGVRRILCLTEGTILSISTSSQIIAASFPPSSSVTRFNVLAQLSITSLPVAMEPVKLILSMPG